MKEVILEVMNSKGCVLRSELWRYILLQLSTGGLTYTGRIDDLQIAVIVDGERIEVRQPPEMEMEDIYDEILEEKYSLGISPPPRGRNNRRRAIGILPMEDET